MVRSGHCSDVSEGIEGFAFELLKGWLGRTFHFCNTPFSKRRE